MSESTTVGLAGLLGLVDHSPAYRHSDSMASGLAYCPAGMVRNARSGCWAGPALNPQDSRGLSNRSRAVGISKEMSLCGSHPQSSHATQHRCSQTMVLEHAAGRLQPSLHQEETHKGHPWLVSGTF